MAAIATYKERGGSKGGFDGPLLSSKPKGADAQGLCPPGEEFGCWGQFLKLLLATILRSVQTKRGPPSQTSLGSNIHLTAEGLLLHPCLVRVRRARFLKGFVVDVVEWRCRRR